MDDLSVPKLIKKSILLDSDIDIDPMVFSHWNLYKNIPKRLTQLRPAPTCFSASRGSSDFHRKSEMGLAAFSAPQNLTGAKHREWGNDPW